MDEKVIIKSERKDFRPFCISLPIFGAAISLFYFFYTLNHFSAHYTRQGYSFGEKISHTFNANGVGFVFLLIPALAVIAYLIYKAWSKIELTVSDKRVYGTAAFGKRVDLPFDSISAVGTSAFNGIAITTASGAIKFVMIKNRDEIHTAVSKLLLERQGKDKPVAATTIKQEIPQSNADELKKYKELLDMGIITQEEFDAKKKQLLGL